MICNSYNSQKKSIFPSSQVFSCNEFSAADQRRGPGRLTDSFLDHLFSIPAKRNDSILLRTCWNRAKLDKQALYISRKDFPKAHVTFFSDKDDADAPSTRLLVTPGGFAFLCYHKKQHLLGKGTSKVVKFCKDCVTGRIFASASFQLGDEHQIIQDLNWVWERESKNFNRFYGMPGFVQRYCEFEYLGKLNSAQIRKRKARYIMDFCNMGSLNCLVQADGISIKNIRLLMRQILKLTMQIHEREWIHRDLKPDNFMCRLSERHEIAENGRYTLLLGDFLSVCSLSNIEERGQYRTTPWYCTPLFADAYLAMKSDHEAMQTASGEELNRLAASFEINQKKVVEASTQSLDMWSIGVIFLDLYFRSGQQSWMKKGATSSLELLTKLLHVPHIDQDPLANQIVNLIFGSNLKGFPTARYLYEKYGDALRGKTQMNSQISLLPAAEEQVPEADASGKQEKPEKKISSPPHKKARLQ